MKKLTKTTSIHKQIVDYCIEHYPDFNLHPRDVFYNHSREGLRLTYQGFALLKDQDFNYTRVSIDDDYVVNSKTILKLSRNMIWPYYLTKKTIMLFGEDDAVTYKLVGNFTSWIDCLG